jgi:hypothetical protein
VPVELETRLEVYLTTQQKNAKSRLAGTSLLVLKLNKFKLTLLSKLNVVMEGRKRNDKTISVPQI